MKKNMSTTDRIVRLIIAAAIVALYLANVVTGTWAYVLLAVAVILALTSVVGFCPLYALLGIHTNKGEKLTS